jgi:hypothetical protein
VSGTPESANVDDSRPSSVVTVTRVCVLGEGRTRVDPDQVDQGTYVGSAAVASANVNGSAVSRPSAASAAVANNGGEQTNHGVVMREQGLATLRFDHGLGLDRLTAMPHDLAEFGVQIRGGSQRASNARRCAACRPARTSNRSFLRAAA